MIGRKLVGVRSLFGTAVVVVSLAAALGAGAAPASAETAWWLPNSTAAPTDLQPGATAQIFATAVDVGDAEASGAAHPIIFSDTLPAQLEVTNVEAEAGPSIGGGPEHQPVVLTCTTSGTTLSCPFYGKLPSTEAIKAKITVKVNEPTGTKTTLPNTVTVEGGEIPRASVTKQLTVNGETTGFGVEQYEQRPESEGGTLDTQAGSHPFQLTTIFDLNKQLETEEYLGKPHLAPVAPALQKNLHFVLPPGLVGNATAVPQCSAADFTTIATGGFNYCPSDTAVGVATVTINEPTIVGVLTAPVPVFNLVPSPGEPVRFGFEIHKVPVVLTTSVRTGSDYGVEVSVHYATEAAQVLNTEVSFWGVPGDPRHDSERGWECIGGGDLDRDGHDEQNLPAAGRRQPHRPADSPDVLLRTASVDGHRRIMERRAAERQLHVPAAVRRLQSARVRPHADSRNRLP